MALGWCKLIFYVMIHSNYSQKIFLRVPNFHQQIPSAKYLLAISRFPAVPVDTENKEYCHGEGKTSYGLVPSEQPVLEAQNFSGRPLGLK